MTQAGPSVAPRRAVRWLAAVVLLATIALAVGSLLLIAGTMRAGGSADANDQQLFAELSIGVSYAVVGWLVASRRSGNPLGWVYLAIGLSQVAEGFLGLAALYGFTVAPGSVPAVDLLAWLGIWAWVPGFGLLISFSLLLFPDGRLPSPRWRPVAWAAVVAMALLGVPTAVVAWSLRGVALIDGSIQVPDAIDRLQMVGLLLMAGVALASVASIVIRFRRSTGREREQLKWFTWAVIPEIVFVVGSGFVGYPPVVWLIGSLFIAPLLPAAIGIAILRYRLYEIDRIISRTVGYAIVSLVIPAAFAGTVLVLQALLAPFTEVNTLAVAASTLLVAALFQPLRSRVQHAVDRRFDRARYDGERIAAAFAGHLRDEVDLLSLEPTLRLAVTRTVAPTSIGMWIRGGGNGP